MIIILPIIVVKYSAPRRLALFCSFVFALWFFNFKFVASVFGPLVVVSEQLRLIESFLCHIFDS